MPRKSVFLLFLMFLLAAGVFWSADLERTLKISGNDAGLSRPPEAGGLEESTVSEASVLPARPSTPKQKPLPNPPETVRAIYLTSWTAGSEARLKPLIDLVDLDERLNAMVIDIKDYSGYLAYQTEVPEAKAAGAENELRIADINGILKRLHEKNIYVIGRITVFQDPVLAKYRPEWAVQFTGGGVWRDKKGLSWLDAGAKPVWDYNIALAKDALERGFDEVNFDYIRFPSDGDLEAAVYPFSGSNPPRARIIRDFFGYLRENLPGAKISADLFGLTTVAADDLGIGQLIEDAYAYFDYVAPMIYPSHYASGFIGYKNPAAYPYEVVKHSLEGALSKRRAFIAANSSAFSSPAKLRPWLQVFDLGAIYDRTMVEAQIRATEEALGADPDAAVGAGWMLWDPKNTYRSYAR